MLDGKNYIEMVESFFTFLVTEFDFRQTKKTENGNFYYDVEYRDAGRVVSVSYENVEDYLQVIVFRLENGMLPDYDDKRRTLHLYELNKRILAKIDKQEIEENSVLFSRFVANSRLERKLLKSAKELRLILKHWDKLLQ